MCGGVSLRLHWCLKMVSFAALEMVILLHAIPPSLISVDCVIFSLLSISLNWVFESGTYG